MLICSTCSEKMASRSVPAPVSVSIPVSVPAPVLVPVRRHYPCPPASHSPPPPQPVRVNVPRIYLCVFIHVDVSMPASVWRLSPLVVGNNTVRLCGGLVTHCSLSHLHKVLFQTCLPHMHTHVCPPESSSHVTLLVLEYTTRMNTNITKLLRASLTSSIQSTCEYKHHKLVRASRSSSVMTHLYPKYMTSMDKTYHI